MKSKHHDNRKNAPARRYSAKLLFQYRVSGSPNTPRLCEERIITFPSLYGRAALSEAKRRGRAAQHSYTNIHGQRVHFEFVGVMELLSLEACDADEVWYEMPERVRPTEGRAKLIPPESKLHAIRNAA